VLALRMRGLPFVNPALEVEAVAFAPWNGRWLGVMLTPWFMNLMLVPLDEAAWIALPVGAKRTWRFPAGAYEFISGDDPALGSHETCSLLSPVLQFADHASARLVAQLAREALFDPANAEVAQFPESNLSPSCVAGPLAQLEASLDAPLSKRDLLRGRFIGGGDGDRR
jgi:[NiFe] hydrogenase assembly HybE family chaperone